MTSTRAPALTLSALREHTGDRWPLPGDGSTRRRWRLLEDVAADDLALAKLVEPHHDAVAILHDLDGPAVRDDEVWAVWAAEPPFAVLSAVETADGWQLTGSKAFCSGASLVTHALVTAETPDGSSLFAVNLASEGIASGRGPAWVGPGMARADTTTLSFSHVRAVPVGDPGAYVRRTGFWLGAIGVAACWLGGARGVARALESAADHLDAHGRAHLGAVRAALDVSGLALDAAAATVDAEVVPIARAERLAQSLRAHVAGTVDEVVSRVGRALGPGPLAFDEEHARKVADLQVFVRQHHAERDLQRLGSPELRDV